MKFTRLKQLIGDETFDNLQNKSVLIFGLGGVGGNACEAIARSGFGTIILVDKDVVDESNINRQIIALDSTINQDKVTVMQNRIYDIDPSITVIPFKTFYNFETKNDIWDTKPDYVIDCIDTITFKIDIIKHCLANKIECISVMGTGNKFHPEQLDIVPLHKTQYDPIARVLRNKLKTEPQYKTIMVVASKEVPRKTDSTTSSPSSNSFVPNTAGLLAASYIFNKAIN